MIQFRSFSFLLDKNVYFSHMDIMHSAHYSKIPIFCLKIQLLKILNPIW